MSAKPWIGLLAAGPISPALSRMANLHVHLGPVAAASLRVAARFSNQLKAGFAALPADLHRAELIFLSGPESAFASLLDLALHSGIDWHGRTVLLLDFRIDSSDLAPLQALGAETGTLDALDGFSRPTFVADAALPSRRLIQRFSAAAASKIFFVAPGRKQVFAAGAAFTGTLFAPLVAATVNCLKSAGLTTSEALQIAERNTLHSLRSWIKSGRKGWSGTVPDRDLDALRRQLRALDTENDILSEYFSNTAWLALLLFGEDPEWLSALDARSSPTKRKLMDETHAGRLVATGRLAANLAHDWNNLLTLLAAQTAELAHQLPSGHHARALAVELENSIALAADPPRRLLNWLRQQQSLLVPCDLNAAIAGIVPLVEIALGRGIGCALDLAPSLPPVLLDQPLLLNALLNLASNAANAMGGRGTFTIRTAAVPSGVEFSVQDTGAGMDEETRRNAFEPFFTTRPADGGVGLGMDTVISMAESHNAVIAIQTAPGQGCRFTFTFPPAAQSANA